MHGHRDMEIVTFVRQGAISHRDSQGNAGRTVAGDVQVMSAGTGIFHAEHNLEKQDTAIFQIWIVPKERGIAPRWETARFTGSAEDGALPLLASGRDEDSDKHALYIHQDAAIYGGRMQAGQSLQQPVKHQAYVLVSTGSVTADGKTLQAGDGAEITGLHDVELNAVEAAEVIVIDVPA